MNNTNTIQVKTSGIRESASFLVHGIGTQIIVGRHGENVAEAAQDEYEKRLKAGSTVSANGVTQWIEFFEILVDGCEICKGEKTKGNRILFTKSNDGQITREVLGTSWRKMS